jgi:hypothetical protein
LHRSFERKRPKIKQIGRFQSVYLVQSVHAPLTCEFALAGARKKRVTMSPEGKVVSAKVVSAKK